MIKLKDLLVEQPPKPSFTKGGESKPPSNKGDGDSKEIKTDIPDSPFGPDVNQIKDKLKQILKQWKVKEYPSDEIRWKLYYKDILKLVNTLDGED
mgnify:FL=1